MPSSLNQPQSVLMASVTSPERKGRMSGAKVFNRARVKGLRMMESAFASYAGVVFDHSWRVMILTIVFMSILSLNCIFRQTEHRMNKLYSLANTKSAKAADVVSHMFPVKRMTTIALWWEKEDERSTDAIESIGLQDGDTRDLGNMGAAMRRASDLVGANSSFTTSPTTSVNSLPGGLLSREVFTFLSRLDVAIRSLKLPLALVSSGVVPGSKVIEDWVTNCGRGDDGTDTGGHISLEDVCYRSIDGQCEVISPMDVYQIEEQWGSAFSAPLFPYVTSSRVGTPLAIEAVMGDIKVSSIEDNTDITVAGGAPHGVRILNATALLTSYSLRGGSQVGSQIVGRRMRAVNEVSEASEVRVPSSHHKAPRTSIRQLSKECLVGLNGCGEDDESDEEEDDMSTDDSGEVDEWDEDEDDEVWINSTLTPHTTNARGRLQAKLNLAEPSIGSSDSQFTPEVLSAAFEAAVVGLVNVVSRGMSSPCAFTAVDDRGTDVRTSLLSKETIKGFEEMSDSLGMKGSRRVDMDSEDDVDGGMSEVDVSDSVQRNMRDESGETRRNDKLRRLVPTDARDSNEVTHPTLPIGGRITVQAERSVNDELAQLSTLEKPDLVRLGAATCLVLGYAVYVSLNCVPARLIFCQMWGGLISCCGQRRASVSKQAERPEISSPPLAHPQPTNSMPSPRTGPSPSSSALSQPTPSTEAASLTSTMGLGWALPAVMGVLSALVGYGAGAGLCYLCGVPHVPLAEGTPFVVLGVGVDDMFVIMNAVTLSLASPKLHHPPKEKGSDTGSRNLTSSRTGNHSPHSRPTSLSMHDEALSHARSAVKEALGESGVAITITTMTNILAFGVGLNSGYFSIQVFCLLTAVSLIGGYIACLTIFLAALSITIRRQLLSSAHTYPTHLGHLTDANSAHVDRQPAPRNVLEASIPRHLAASTAPHVVPPLTHTAYITRIRSNPLSTSPKLPQQGSGRRVMRSQSMKEKGSVPQSSDVSYFEEDSQDPERSDQNGRSVIELSPITAQVRPSHKRKLQRNSSFSTQAFNNLVSRAVGRDDKKMPAGRPDDSVVVRVALSGSSVVKVVHHSASTTARLRRKDRCIVNNTSPVDGSPLKSNNLVAHTDDHFTHHATPRESRGLRFVFEQYGVVLEYRLVKLCVLIAFAVFLGFALWGASMVDVGLSIRNVIPVNSYLNDMFDLRESAFSSFGDEVTVVITKNSSTSLVQWDSPYVQTVVMKVDGAMRSAGTHIIFPIATFIHKQGEMIRVEGEGDKATFTSKLLSWLDNTPGGQGASSYFKRQTTLLYSPVDPRLAHLTTSPTTPDTTQVELVAAKGSAWLPFIDDTKASLELLQRMTKAANEAEELGLFTAYASSPLAVLWESDEVILRSALLNMGAALLAIAVVSSLLIPNVTMGVVIVMMILLLDVGLIGYMTFWGLKLNMLTMINLVISIGFSVDYTTHVALCFVRVKEQRRDENIQISNNEAMRETLRIVGPPLVHGAVSTLLAVILLHSAEKYALTVCFKMISMVICFAAAIGLILLPVILSLQLTGGTVEADETDVNQSIEAKGTKKEAIGDDRTTHEGVQADHYDESNYPSINDSINSVMGYQHHDVATRELDPNARDEDVDSAVSSISLEDERHPSPTSQVIGAPSLNINEETDDEASTMSQMPLLVETP
eukprot:GHVN01060344.1.p1 GENE.GHVN01060344.1~~GHVN01060344.1.p1  ORF type:complete len:1663 (+),score=402.68 GHVN01060344.1:218-5206(+)